MDKYYDFSNCKKSRKQFGGSDKKESVFLDKDRYMLKFPDRIDDDKRNDFNGIYRNNVHSEYISCHIINALGYMAQETLLGRYKGKEVVACKDFCKDGYELNEFEKYKSSFSIDFENTRYPEIYDVVRALSEDKENVGIDPDISLAQFWDIFMLDVLLGNFDRHTGNWGYLYNDEREEVRLAPIYDCGACLYPMLNDSGMEKVINDEKLILARVYDYPKPAFEMNGERLTYNGFLESDYAKKDSRVTEAISKLKERYDKKIIEEVIGDTPNLSEIRSEFYVKMIDERMKRLIMREKYLEN